MTDVIRCRKEAIPVSSRSGNNKTMFTLVVFAMLTLFLVTGYSATKKAPSLGQRMPSPDVPGEEGAPRDGVDEIPEKGPGVVRLLTYNIQWGMGSDGVRDLNRIAAQLKRIDADIVILNEVDVNWHRSGNVDQPQYLVRATNYEHHHFGVALTTRALGRLGASRYGNLLLSRFPVLAVETVPLPGGVGREPRAAVVAVLDIHGEPWVVAGTHLGLHGGDRLRQVDALLAAVQRHRRLAGASASEAATTISPTLVRTSEPKPEAIAHPAAAATSEPKSEATTHPAAATTPEPKSEATTHPAAATTPEPKSEATTHPAAATTPEPKSEATAQPTPATTPEPKPDATTHPAAALASRRPDVPAVIFGDFNARPTEPEILRIVHSEQVTADGDGFFDAQAASGRDAELTFPYPDAYARIDYIFLSGFFSDRLLDAGPLALPGSDHFPVIADLSLAQPAPAVTDR